MNPDSIIKKAANRRLLKRFIAMMSAVVLLLTTAGLRHKADTLSYIATCGYPDHEHVDSCYDADGALTCGLHVHTDACYQERPDFEEAPLLDLPEPEEAGEAPTEAIEAAPEETSLTLGEEETLDAETLEDDYSEPDPEEYAGEEEPELTEDEYSEGATEPAEDEYPEEAPEAEENEYSEGATEPAEDEYSEGATEPAEAEVSEEEPEAEQNEYSDEVTEPADAEALEEADEPSDQAAEHLDEEAPEEAVESAGYENIEEAVLEAPVDLAPEAPAEIAGEVSPEEEIIADEFADAAEPEAEDAAFEEAEAPVVNLHGRDLPISLRQLLAEAGIDAEPVPEDIEPAETEHAEPTPEDADTEPADIEYDEALLSIEPADGDWLLAPLAEFDETAVTLTEQGSRVTLRLANYSHPACHFEGEAGGVRVSAEAPVGAFPEGTTMALAPVEDAEKLDTIGGAVDRADAVVKRVAAVDISFRDADGVEIEPRLPIDVVMTAVDPEQYEDAVIVHLDDDGNATQLDCDVTDDAAAFTADSFSIYAMVLTQRVEASVLMADGQLCRVEVSYGDEARIPEGARLSVTPIEPETEAYDAALSAVVEDRLSRGEPTDAMGFAAMDISILDAEGNVVEPAATVQVKLSITELPGVEDLSEVADTLAVQHHVETEGGTLVETVAEGGAELVFNQLTDEAVATGLEAEFDTVSFSAYTITWTRIEQNASIPNGDFILLGWDAVKGQYYALVPSTELKAVPVQFYDATNQVIYDGNENLYWTGETNTYWTGWEWQEYSYIRFKQNGKTYYLTMGTLGSSAGVSNTKTPWYDWDGYLYCQNDCFLRCENGTFKVVNVSRDSAWQSKSMIYFAQGPDSVTVHYGTMDNGTFTEFNSEQIDPSQKHYGSLSFLIHDVPGYQYDKTYYSDRDTSKPSKSALPVIEFVSGKWNVVTEVYADEERGIGAYYANVSGKHVYVTYKPRPTATKGGKTVVEPAKLNLAAPEILKTRKDNGNGTNTLTLDITGRRVESQAYPKTDVIVIVDVSGSMYFDMAGTGREPTENENDRRLTKVQKALYRLADALMSKNKDPKDPVVKMGLVSFSNIGKIEHDLTDDKTQFYNAVRNMKAAGGTNWEDALQIANGMDVRPDADTYVIFVTDGDPTVRVTRGVYDSGAIVSDETLYADGNTNQEISFLEGNELYVQYGVFGTGNSMVSESEDNHTSQASLDRNRYYALQQAYAILDAGKHLYCIGVSDDAPMLHSFVTEALESRHVENPEKYLFTVHNDDQITKAIDTIGSRITSTMGYNDVRIVDGITDLTAMMGKRSDLWQGEKDGYFTYYRFGGDYGETPVVWENPPTKATYNPETGAVEWNLGENFVLEDGVTYRVAFDVWPSQQAYDLIAGLNNGTIRYDDLDDEVKKQITVASEASKKDYPSNNYPFTYTLKTNRDYDEPGVKASYRTCLMDKDQNITYQTDSQSKDYNTVLPMPLIDSQMKVRKVWDDGDYAKNRKPVTLVVKEGDRTFATVELSEENALPDHPNIWEKSINIATGLRVGKRVYEAGHDYTLEEADTGYQYELTANTVHPMLDNSWERMINTQGDAAELTATNHMRGYVDLRKQVYGPDGETEISTADTGTFHFKVSLSRGGKKVNYKHYPATEGTKAEDVVEKNGLRVDGAKYPYWYRVFTGTGITDPNYEELYSGIIEDGEIFEITAAQTFQLFNLPSDTEYAFEEQDAPGYALAAGCENPQSGRPEFGKGQTVTFKNQLVPYDVYLVKADMLDPNTKLSGAKFTLYADAEHKAVAKDADGEEIGEIMSSADGAVAIGSLLRGTYYLAETEAPEGYSPLTGDIALHVGETDAPVTYALSGSQPSAAEKSEDENAYIVTVLNARFQGYALPATGGPGPEPTLALGLSLILIACLGLALRRRWTD